MLHGMPQDEGMPAGDLQFDHAELKTDAAQRPVCKACNLEIGTSYFTINGHMICPRCKDQFQEKLERGSGVGGFLLAALLGTGAAILGAAVWYAVVKLTNMQWSIIAIAIGFLVGTAVKKGSGGRGGWIYQGLAMFLTYSAIAIAVLPYIWNELNEKHVSIFSQPFLLVIVFISPFLGGFQNILGILIIGIGLYQAWKINKKRALTLAGPFQISVGALR
jgi:hypothetical protein